MRGESAPVPALSTLPSPVDYSAEETAFGPLEISILQWGYRIFLRIILAVVFPEIRHADWPPPGKVHVPARYG